MAFPTIVATSTANQASPVTLQSITVPASRQTGDLLVIACMGGTDAVQSVPTGWTGVVSDQFGGSRSLSVFTKISTGSEGFTFWSTPTAMESAATCTVIRGASGTVTVSPSLITAASATPDPPSVTASWGADDNLVGVFIGAEDDDQTITAWPSGYTLGQAQTVSGGGTNAGCTMGTAFTTTTAATEDPGTATLQSSEGQMLRTIIFQPAAASGADIDITSVTSPTVTQGDQNVQVTVAYQNQGPDASGDFDVVYPIPTGATFDAGGSTAGCAVDGSDIRCAVTGPISNGGTGNVVIQFDISNSAPVGTQNITAEIQNQTVTDPTAGNDTQAATFTINELVVTVVGTVTSAGGVNLNDASTVEFVPNLDLEQVPSNVRVLWDLDGDGDWDEPEEDITEYVQAFSTSIGRDPNSQLKGRAGPGRFNAALVNSDDRFNINNPDSPLNQPPFNLQAGGKIRVQASETTGTDPVLLSRYVFDQASTIETDDLGNTWTVNEGAFKVTADGAEPQTADENDATTDIGQLDFYAQIHVPYWDRPNRVGILYRYDDPDNYGFVGITSEVSPYATQMYVSETIGGVFTLGSSVLLPLQEAFYIGLEVSGGNLKAYLNGELLIDENTVRSSTSTVVGFESQWEGRLPARISEFYCWDSKPEPIPGVIWTGISNDIVPSSPGVGNKTAQLTAEGPLTAANEADVRTIDTIGQFFTVRGLSTGEFAGFALGRAGLLHPPGPIESEINMGARGRRNMKALTALHEAEQIEFGRVYETPEGQIGLRSRSNKDGSFVVSSWSDKPGDQFICEDVILLESKRELTTEVTSSVATRSPFLRARTHTANDHVAGIQNITIPALVLPAEVQVGDLMIVVVYTTIYQTGETWEAPPGWFAIYNPEGPQRPRVFAKRLVDENVPNLPAATFYRADNPSAGSWVAWINWYGDWFGDPQNGVNVTASSLGEPDSGASAQTGIIDMDPVVNPWGNAPTLHSLMISGMDANTTNNPQNPTIGENDLPDMFLDPLTVSQPGAATGHSIGIQMGLRIDSDAVTNPSRFKRPPTGYDHLEVLDIAIRGYEGDNPTADGVKITTRKQAIRNQIGAESSYELPGEGFASVDDAENYNNAVLARFGTDRPALKIMFTATKRPDYRSQAINRRQGDQIFVDTTHRAGFGFKGTYTIERISHRWSKGNTFWFTEWELAPV